MRIYEDNGVPVCMMIMGCVCMCVYEDNGVCVRG